MKQKAYIFPGQGAQKPFMGQSFHNKFLEAKEVYQKAEDILSMNITSKIFSSDETFLTQTKFCQIALFVTSIAILEVMRKQMPEIAPVVTGGLSLGEYTALVAAKKISYEALLPLVQKRAAFMDEASRSCPQGMAAVIGLSEGDIPSRYQVANLNCPRQVVLAGSLKEMEQAGLELKKKGGKVLPLKVSGAFHSSYMESAKNKLSHFIKESAFTSSEIAAVMNVTGKVTDDIEEMKSNLIKQICSKTRWMDCIKEMEKFDVDYIELGSSVLTGMNRKIKVANSSVSIEETEDLEVLYERV